MAPRQCRIACIIFDCDGVLVDSELIAARVAAECFTEAGMPIGAEELITRFAGVAGDRVTAQLAEQFGVMPDPGMTERRRHRIMAAFQNELKAVEDVDRVLPMLPQVKCVASSSHPERLSLSLRITGLEKHFQKHIFSSTLVARGKPAPDLFLYAADKVGQPSRHCLVVEDSVYGIAAAKAAGMLAFGFVGGRHCTADSNERLRAVGADAVFAGMAELPALIETFQSS